MVNRQKLLSYLDSRGCGSAFLSALQSSYEMTKGQVGSSHFTALSGIRQGLCTSCPLFVLFIEPTIDAISSVGHDDWLGDIHSLLLMDDTVVLATSREMMTAKLAALKRCTDNIGMIINPSKSQYIAVLPDNTQPFLIENISISHTPVYVYLGTPISPATVSDQVKLHIKSKTSHILKFQSFLVKNRDAPYTVKKSVWNSALKTALFYSCETWLANDLRVAEKAFNTTLKNLLGVRATSCNDIVYAESGYFGAKEYIYNVQKSFFKKLMDRDQYPGSYLETVINMAQAVKCPAGIVMRRLISGDLTGVNRRDAVIQAIRTSTGTRRMAYGDINPSLSVHPLYDSYDVPEYDRIAFTRLRLGSHHLQYEMGRWSRTPQESRMCPCGIVQSDKHVLLDCELTRQARQDLFIPGDINIEQFYNYTDFRTLAKFCNLVISTYH